MKRPAHADSITGVKIENSGRPPTGHGSLCHV